MITAPIFAIASSETATSGHIGMKTRRRRPGRVAGPAPQRAQRAGELASLLVELAIRELADLARLALPDDRFLVVRLGVAVAVEAALHDVHPPADPPSRPGLAFREVDDLVVMPVEGDVDVLDRRVPEPLDVIVRALQELGEGVDAVLVHESLEPALRDNLGARFPHHVPDHDRLHGLWILGSDSYTRIDGRAAGGLCGHACPGPRAGPSRGRGGRDRGCDAARRREPTTLPRALRRQDPCLGRPGQVRRAAWLLTRCRALNRSLMRSASTNNSQ